MTSPTVHMVWHEPQYRMVFQSLAGPVGRDLLRRARRLELRAQLSVGVDTGALLSSLDSAFFSTPGGDLFAKVGANPFGEHIGYAHWHHEGTPPHIIRPRSPNGMLRFPDRRTGRIVYSKFVRHPGTEPNKYLTDHIREAVS